MSAPDVAIIGAGPAGLIAAETVAAAGASVIIYDRMPSVARKFLMAGRGGLNLTHSEPLDIFLTRYGDAPPLLRKAIEAFPPQALREWAHGLGQDTFIGSSGRVFPKAFKASPLLRAWLARLDNLGVRLALRHRWLGWDENGALRFETPQGPHVIAPRATILALGGASWPRLGSDGSWQDLLSSQGIAVSDLKPANCGFHVAWSDSFRERFEGQPLKNVVLGFDGHTSRGEMVVTKDGIEGGGIYALSAVLREGVAARGHAILTIDLRPDLASPDIATRLSRPSGKQSIATFLRKALTLPPPAIGLLHEAAFHRDTRLAAMTPDELADLVRALPVRIEGAASLARAISTAGGVSFADINPDFGLRRRPDVFMAGEMLDWEAPTGGYLLQASFATGVAAGRGVLGRLGR
ncbi:TIGR03862 family flavoprotein [Afipia felis]|uniref:Dihydropyrimidine dehydrogenase subunit A n=2 Tax=Afipia felis TaxID=1035 RepID=A0A380WB23_AFIFE|nr:TIGR03862 family flavoprotein [Afipia felis]EKS28570.1 HI0933 family flavoprotein [Afipia felis ATCC 53690]SUU77278.1 dihydropyrimidine dehydrogenase subunit A [Afipia felis]SUU85345.1 dihydropyrimidine dehydrogenase subunit A [Afipia felis]